MTHTPSPADPGAMRFSDTNVIRQVPGHRRRVRAWASVLGGGAVVFVAYLVGVVWRVGRRIDDRALRWAERLGVGVAPEVHAVLAYLSPAVVCVGVVAVVVRRWRRGDQLEAATALALVAGSELIAQGLKLLLPRTGGGTNTLPSGHLTMIAAFVLVLVLMAVARRRRILVVLGALAVTGSAAGTWVIGWHRPSDSLAACGVVALCWGATRLVAETNRFRRDEETPVSGPPHGPDDRPTVPSMRPLARVQPPATTPSRPPR